MDSVLTVSGLCKRYPGFSLENISFSLEKGHIMGFLGRNGAGKTTTMKAILGLVHADGGSVHILGQNIDEADVRARIGYAAGGAAFYPRKTVAQIAASTPGGMKKPSPTICRFFIWTPANSCGSSPRA